MNISQAAKYCGLSSKTIRFYEQQGVIPPAQRSANGYRTYNEAQLDRLCFIKRARDLGFSLEDSGSLLQLSMMPNRTSAQVKGKAEKHLQQIKDQIAQLQSMQAVLEAVVVQCAGDEGTACPILDKLNGCDL